MYVYFVLVLCLVESSLVWGQDSKEPKISERLVKEYKSGSTYSVPSEPKSSYTQKRSENIYEPQYQQDNTYERGYATDSSSFQLPVTNQENLLSAPVRRVATSISCLKTHMIVSFEFSTGFNGYIYPHEQFPSCILFRGHQSRKGEINLSQGPCGKNLIENEDNPEFLPVIEHRLMIQWEKDFVCVDDSSVIVRCDHPDSFNKTIAWDFTTLELSSELERGQHPGPTMFMEIQKGEGPTAPVLSHRVYIGDVLTLVFTLSDDVFWFDSNMLSCSAVNGGGQVTTVDQYSKNSLVSYTGVLPVIEDGCSLKPKIFSHFRKEKIVKDGNLITLQYAVFKAFRFPTSDKILIQCDVQICYKECADLPRCQTGFHPRQSNERRRRSIDDSESLEQEKVLVLKKTIEIWPNDYLNSDLPTSDIKIATLDSLPQSIQYENESCYSAFTFFSWIGILSVANAALLFFVIFFYNDRRSTSMNK